MNKEEIVVEIRETKPMIVAYVKNVGPYAGDKALFDKLFGQLFQWAGSRGLVSDNPVVLTMYYDDPKITEEAKLQIRVCLGVSDDTETSGIVGKMEVPGGTYAVGRFYIDVSEYGVAWNYMYGEWMPASGYEPDDRKCFELYLNDPDKDPEGKHDVEIYVPVRPVS